MFPGLMTKLSDSTVASASSITVKSDVVRITGSTQINTILAPLMNNPGATMVILIPVDGAVTLGTSGNISVGIAMAQNRAVWLVWSEVSGKWHINSGV